MKRLFFLILLFVCIYKFQVVSKSVFRDIGNTILKNSLQEQELKQSELVSAEKFLNASILPNEMNFLSYRSISKISVLLQDYDLSQKAFITVAKSNVERNLAIGWLLTTGRSFLDSNRQSYLPLILQSLSTLTNENDKSFVPCDAAIIDLVFDHAFALHGIDSNGEELTLKLINTAVPHCATSYYYLGKLYFDQGNFNDAIRSFKYGLDVDTSTIALGYEGLSESYFELNKMNDARLAAENAIQNNGGPIGYMLLGRISQNEGDLKKAQDYYLLSTQQARQSTSDNWAVWKAYFYLGWIAFDQNEDLLAISYFQSASQVMPGTNSEPQALYYVGQVYQRRKLLAKAIKVYQQALILSSNDWEWKGNIFLSLANAFRDNGQVSDAIDAYNTALLYFPDDSEIRYQINLLLDTTTEP